jgi:5'-methylthioadenosine phosphorylase
MPPVARIPLRIGLIGGTGLGDALGAEAAESRQVETPFGPPSSALRLMSWDGVEVVLLQRHGPGHVHPPSRVPYRANIYALKSLGVTHIVASGATGSLREHIHPGELVVADQVIDKTQGRAATFYDDVAVHVEMAEPFCPLTRGWLLAAAARLPHLTVHPTGTYVCMEGPAFSTRAESLMHRAWGADLVGMTCMPEAKLAREAEIAYALVALPTDYDCWRPHDSGADEQELLQQILGNLERATQRSIELIKAALSDISSLASGPSPAHEALRLAIWSQKDAIAPQKIEKLRVLWGRYFE